MRTRSVIAVGTRRWRCCSASRSRAAAGGRRRRSRRRPAAPPPDYGPPITNEQAKAVAAAAFAEAKKNNWRMAFAIVGPAASWSISRRWTAPSSPSTEIAQGKARTSVMYRRPSKAFADQYAAGNTAFTTFPERPVASEGGVPIIVNGKIVGAIGASGGTGQQDGVAAAAGAGAAK